MTEFLAVPVGVEKTPRVVSLDGEAMSNSFHRQQLLQTVAEAYDAYKKKNPEEPDAIAFVLGGMRQTAAAGWYVGGDTVGATTTFLCLAQVTLLQEITNPNAD